MQYYESARLSPRGSRSYCAIFLSYVLPISQRNIDFIMLHTKEKDYHQILVDGENYDTLHSKYGASRSFNEVITEILRHHETAVSIIGDCESCKAKFKEAITK